jgi:hypothetical protein
LYVSVRVQALAASGAPIDNSPCNSANPSASGWSQTPTAKDFNSQDEPEDGEERETDVFSWEYVWVAVLVLALLAGIGITAICLF